MWTVFTLTYFAKKRSLGTILSITTGTEHQSKGRKKSVWCPCPSVVFLQVLKVSLAGGAAPEDCPHAMEGIFMCFKFIRVCQSFLSIQCFVTHQFYEPFVCRVQHVSCQTGRAACCYLLTMTHNFLFLSGNSATVKAWWRISANQCSDNKRSHTGVMCWEMQKWLKKMLVSLTSPVNDSEWDTDSQL